VFSKCCYFQLTVCDSVDEVSSMVSFYNDAFATHALESNRTFQHCLVV
jgi:hypothetical protein